MEIRLLQYSPPNYRSAHKNTLIKTHAASNIKTTMKQATSKSTRPESLRKVANTRSTVSHQQNTNRKLAAKK